MGRARVLSFATWDSGDTGRSAPRLWTHRQDLEAAKCLCARACEIHMQQTANAPGYGQMYQGWREGCYLTGPWSPPQPSLL